MQTALVWAARVALLIVFGVALAGALDPHHSAKASAPPPDVVEHIGYGYLLTVLTIASVPRANPWLVGAGYLALGVGFETLQILGLVSGTFQWKDMAANPVGVLAALLPMLLARRRR